MKTSLLRIIFKHKWLITTLLLITLLESGIYILIPYFAKLQIDELQKAHASLAMFIVFLAIPFVIQSLKMLLIQPVSNHLSTHLSEYLRLDMQKLIYEKQTSLDNSFFDNNSDRRLFNIALNSASSLSNLTWEVQNIFSSVINILGVFPILLLIDYRLLLITLFSSLIQATINNSQQKAEARLALYQEKQQDNMWPVENLFGRDFGDFRLTGDTQPMFKKLDQNKKDLLKLRLDRDRLGFLYQNFSWLTAEPIDNLSRIIVAAGVILGKFTLGDYSMINSYLGRLNSAFRRIADNLKYLEQSRLNLYQINYFLRLPSRLVVSRNAIDHLPLHQSLVFSHVHFSYPAFKAEEKQYLKEMIQKTEDFFSKHWSFRGNNNLDFWQKYITEKDRPKKVINNLNFVIKPGMMTALLGRNGAGKTTITNLAMHTLEPNQGQILYGGKNIRSYDLTTWLSQFSVVQQYPYLAHRFSLKENLSFGVKNPTEKKLWSVLEQVGLAEYIKSIPKKLNSVLGEDTNVSGGQRQLLAICRALLQNRPFLILDEALSQLDIEKEAALMDLLKAQAKTSDILFITHRITTARKADYIYMLDQGKIVEEGTHTDLLAQKGLYAHFWDLQTIS